jgi:hypothetical protein
MYATGCAEKSRKLHTLLFLDEGFSIADQYILEIDLASQLKRKKKNA